jgi:hypothetical protein
MRVVHCRAEFVFIAVRLAVCGTWDYCRVAGLQDKLQLAGFCLTPEVCSCVCPAAYSTLQIWQLGVPGRIWRQCIIGQGYSQQLTQSCAFVREGFSALQRSRPACHMLSLHADEVMAAAHASS